MYKLDGVEIQEIDGPKVSWLQVPNAHGVHDNYPYVTYVIGKKIKKCEFSDLSRGFESKNDISSDLAEKMHSCVNGLLLGHKYRKEPGAEMNMGENPMIVWRLKPTLEFTEELCGDDCTASVMCRLAIISHGDKDRVIKHLKSLGTDNA